MLRDDKKTIVFSKSNRGSVVLRALLATFALLLLGCGKEDEKNVLPLAKADHRDVTSNKLVVADRLSNGSFVLSIYDSNEILLIEKEIAGDGIGLYPKLIASDGLIVLVGDSVIWLFDWSLNEIRTIETNNLFYDTKPFKRIHCKEIALADGKLGILLRGYDPLHKGYASYPDCLTVYDVDEGRADHTPLFGKPGNWGNVVEQRGALFYDTGEIAFVNDEQYGVLPKADIEYMIDEIEDFGNPPAYNIYHFNDQFLLSRIETTLLGVEGKYESYAGSSHAT